MASSTTVTMSSPKVVKKVYKVKYKQPGQENKNISSYNQHTDSNIFELGNAFQTGEFDIDAFLNQMGDKGATTVKGDDGKTTITTVTSDDGPMIDIDGDGIPDIPAKTTKRIITIKHGDDDDDTGTAKSPTRPDHLVLPDIREIGGGYTPSSSHLHLNDIDDEGTPTEETSLIVDPGKPDKKTPLKPKVDPKGKGKETPKAKVDKPGKKDQPGKTEERDDDDIIARPSRKVKPKPSFFLELDDDDDMLISSEDEVIQPRWYTELCPGRKLRRRERKKSNLMEKEKKGGAKSGMIASEVSTPGSDSEMNAMQLMIMNYNRMLEERPNEFRDNLFRAVKLNGLDVVKLLCRLARRKNIPLASEKMREPDSSATILHVALLLDLPDIVGYLVNSTDRDLLMATYTKEEYQNQTALHVAAANGNLESIEMILKGLSKPDRKKLLNTVADGTYFRNEHAEGQLCVSAAAWSKNSDSLYLLAKYGASFATPNLSGNTLLHCIVNSSAADHSVDYQKLVDKVFKAVGVWAEHRRYSTTIPGQLKLEQQLKQKVTFHRLLELQNNDGMSPLILAAKLNSPLMMSLINMEDIYKIPQTKLGSVAWVTYDVTDVASFAMGSYNKFSVLHVLGHNGHTLSENNDEEPDDKLSTLDSEPFKSLIDGKWNVYRWIYYGWFLVHLSHMILFTSMTAHAAPPWKNTSQAYGLSAEEPVGDHSPKTYMWGTIIFPVMYMILEVLDLIGNYPYSFQFMYNMSFFTKARKRVTSEFVIMGNGPYRFVLFGHSFHLIAWFALYLNEDDRQVIVLSISLLLGWIFLLFFTRGLNQTSRFSLMIQKMFFMDLMYFMGIFALIMLAFTMSIGALFSNVPGAGTGTAMGMLTYTMFNIVVEIQEKDDMPPCSYQAYTTTVVLAYTLIGVVLMLNMLIAMMNTSYEAVRLTRENLWKQQQLSIMLMIERRLFWCKKLCAKSESKVWYKKWEHSTRAYMDISTT